MEQVLKSPPLFTDDFIVFGILAILLALIFYTSSLNHPFWKKFYTIFPALLMCYLLPSILSSLNIIATDWNLTDASGGFILDENGEGIRIHSSLYKISSRFLLPAALILLTLSIDLKALLKLGRKALIMFFAGTVGVIIGVLWPF